MARSRKSRYADDYRLLLRQLVDARNAAGVTQIELAASMGTSQSILSKLERGVVRMDLMDACPFLLVKTCAADRLSWRRFRISCTRSVM